MKKILISLFVLIISFTTYSQEEVVIPKGTNKIILKTGLKESDNIKLILKVLKENDFEISKLDTTTYQIQTTERNLKNGKLPTTIYKLNFNINKETISITGRFSIQISIRIGNVIDNSEYSEITNRGMSGSPFKECFKEMNELCLKIVNQDKIEYTTKN
jgi:hypothetical protein